MNKNGVGNGFAFYFSAVWNLFPFSLSAQHNMDPVNTKVKMNFYGNFRMQTRYINTFPSIDEKSR